MSGLRTIAPGRSKFLQAFVQIVYKIERLLRPR